MCFFLTNYSPFLAFFHRILPNPGEYGQELKGAAKGSGIELGTLVAMNLIYDFSAFCTSIVGRFFVFLFLRHLSFSCTLYPFIALHFSSNLTHSLFVYAPLAQNDDGTIYHSRNLDYPIEGLRNITAEIHYKKVRRFASSRIHFLLFYRFVLTFLTPPASLFFMSFPSPLGRSHCVQVHHLCWLPRLSDRSSLWSRW